MIQQNKEIESIKKLKEKSKEIDNKSIIEAIKEKTSNKYIKK